MSWGLYAFGFLVYIASVFMIGLPLAKLSWNLWWNPPVVYNECDRLTKFVVHLLFPVTFDRGNIGDRTAVTPVAIFRGEYIFHYNEAEWNADPYALYLVLASLLWPLRVCWSLLHLMAASVF